LTYPSGCKTKETKHVNGNIGEQICAISCLQTIFWITVIAKMPLFYLKTLIIKFYSLLIIISLNCFN